MILTNEQEQAIKIILSKYNNNEKYVVISGYAGTGKSTLAKVAIDALNVSPERVVYAAFTGKAAEVLRKKGNPNAITLHKLLYDHIPKKNGGFIRKPKNILDYDIVLVDEISMAPRSMLEMLLKHRVFCIFMGDPFQLPQIDKEESHNFLQHPDIFLSTIMRQEEESEIIRLTMAIREQKAIGKFSGKEVMVVDKPDLSTGMLTWADQILVGTNASRQQINSQMRELLGYSGLPQDGERMICLRNYWEDYSNFGDSLVNGTTGTIHNPFETFRRIPQFIKNDRRDLPVIMGDFVADDGSTFGSVEMDKDMIMMGQKCIDWRTAYQLGRLAPKIGDIVPREFSFAYAITCHKAQGSEWDKVLVIEDRFPFEPLEHARWLYTACTRASEKLVLVKN